MKKNTPKPAKTYTILSISNPLFAVASSSGNTYLVDLTFAGNPMCNCRGRQFHPTCSHIKFVQGVLAGQQAAPVAPLEAVAA